MACHSLCFVSYQHILFLDMDLGGIIVLSRNVLTFLLQSKFLLCLAAVWFSLKRPEWNSFAGTFYVHYIHHRCEESVSYFDEHILRCVSNVSSINFSLHLWIGLLDSDLVFPSFCGLFPLRAVTTRDAVLDLFPSICTGFFRCLWTPTKPIA